MNPQKEEALSYVTLWFKRTWRQRPAYDGRYLVMWVVEAWACHEPNASFTNTSAKPANCTTNLSIFSPLSSSPCTFKAHSSTHWLHQLMSTQTETERQRFVWSCRRLGSSTVPQTNGCWASRCRRFCGCASLGWASWWTCRCLRSLPSPLHGTAAPRTWSAACVACMPPPHPPSPRLSWSSASSSSYRMDAQYASLWSACKQPTHPTHKEKLVSCIQFSVQHKSFLEDSSTTDVIDHTAT